MVWRWYVIPCVRFYFLFRTKVKKWYFDESALPQGYDTFFQNVILKVTLSQLCSKFFLNNYVGHDNNMLTTAFWMIPGSVREWIMIHANYFIKTWVNIMKQKSTKLPGKLSLSKKKKNNPSLQQTLHRNKGYVNYCYTFFLSNFQTNLVFYLTQYLLAYWRVVATFYLHSYVFIIDTLWILKFSQCLFL